MRHFRRCQGNRFCEESLNQGGKRWVVSRCGSKNEEEVLIPSSSTRASCKRVPVPSCDRGNLSDSPSPISTTKIPEKFDRVKERTRSHTPNNTGNVIQKSKDAHQAKQFSRLQSQVDSVQIKLKGSAILSDVDTLVVAEGSATGSSSSRLAKCQETPILYLPDLKGKARDATCGSRKEKSPEQRERRKERRRRAQQIRRTMKSDKQNSEPTPRVFMQWEKSEVRNLLYKQELTLKSAHQAALQKQAATMTERYQAELQKQAATMNERYQAELQKQSATIMRYQAEPREQAVSMNERYQAELREQAATMYERHQAELQRQSATINERYQAKLREQSATMTERHQAELQKQSAIMNLRYQAELQERYQAMLQERYQAMLQTFRSKPQL